MSQERVNPFADVALAIGAAVADPTH